MLRGPTVLIEELCLLLLGPAQQSWMFLDVCDRPRSSGQSSSMRTVQLFWMPLRELPEKHLGKLCISLRGALIAAPRPGTSVWDPQRLLRRAEQQRQVLPAERSAAFIGASPGSSRGSTEESCRYLCEELLSLLLGPAQ